MEDVNIFDEMKMDKLEASPDKNRKDDYIQLTQDEL